MNNPIKKMLRVHKECCKMNEYSLVEDRRCTCGRDAALQLYEDMVNYLLVLGEHIEEIDPPSPKSIGHESLENLIARLV